MLVFQLHQDHVAALMDLVRGDDGQDLVVPMIIPRQEGRVGRADLERRLEFQPQRVSARVPFGADVGADADDGIQAEFLGRGEEAPEILVAREIPLVFPRLVEIPEGVGFDRIEPCSLELTYGGAS